MLSGPPPCGCLACAPIQTTSATASSFFLSFSSTPAWQAPDHAIFGEEQGYLAGGAGSEWLWVVDPIDGTKSFITGGCWVPGQWVLGQWVLAPTDGTASFITGGRVDGRVGALAGVDRRQAACGRRPAGGAPPTAGVSVARALRMLEAHAAAATNPGRASRRCVGAPLCLAPPVHLTSPPSTVP